MKNIDLERFDFAVRAEVLQARNPDLELDFGIRLASLGHARFMRNEKRIMREAGRISVKMQQEGLDFDRVLNASLTNETE